MSLKAYYFNYSKNQNYSIADDDLGILKQPKHCRTCIDVYSRSERQFSPKHNHRKIKYFLVNVNGNSISPRRLLPTPARPTMNIA